jgi:hypothetical protein
VPGGSAQTRDYYSDSSSRRRKSLDRSNSIRKIAVAVVAEIDELKSVEQGVEHLGFDKLARWEQQRRGRGSKVQQTKWGGEGVGEGSCGEGLGSEEGWGREGERKK